MKDFDFIRIEKAKLQEELGKLEAMETDIVLTDAEKQGKEIDELLMKQFFADFEDNKEKQEKYYNCMKNGAKSSIEALKMLGYTFNFYKGFDVHGLDGKQKL